MDGIMKKDNELIALREANEAKDKALKKAESKYNRLKGWYRNRYTLMKSSLIEEFNERESHHLALIERLSKKVAIRDEMVKKLEEKIKELEKHSEIVFENYQKANRDSDKYKKSFLDLNRQHQIERTILILLLVVYIFFF
jgi:hypothetical protein